MDGFWYVILSLNLILLVSSGVLYQFVVLPPASRSITVVSIVLNAVVFLSILGYLKHSRIHR